MEDYPKEIKLRDGRSVTLRMLQADDEERLVEFFGALPRGSTQFLKHDVRDAAVVKRFVTRMSPDSVWPIVAVTPEGKMVADATLHTVSRGWRRHIGEVRGVVAEEYRHQGLATAMVRELVEHASARGLRKLKAEILDSQQGAFKVFKRMGFKEEARLKQHALDLDGQLHDILILTNSVDDLWRNMEELISEMEIAYGQV
jgi:RimJ/RimL family protein N-acetyltransferase